MATPELADGTEIRLVQRRHSLKVQPFLTSAGDPARRINTTAICIEQQRHHHRWMIGRVSLHFGVGAHDRRKIQLIANEIANEVGRMPSGNKVRNRRRKKPDLINFPGAKHFAHKQTESPPLQTVQSEPVVTGTPS